MSAEWTTLELKVNNHPGVMLHVVGLFSRRAFNLEGIACLPCRDDRFSRMWLRVKNDSKLPQIVEQLKKLHDTQEVREHEASHEAFERLEQFFGSV